MSENIHQIFVANPITSNAATDLMYFGQSPYGVGNDAAMTYANFSAQFSSKTLTSAHIFVGSAGNVATDVAVSGDVALANTGAMTVSKIGGVAISLAGSFTTAGAFAATFTFTGITGVTFPTSGTLATTSQLLSSPLTTKGDIWGFTTVDARLPVGTTNGQVLQVASGAAAGLAYSTATYPTVATSTGSFIYANGTNFVASTSLWPNTVGSAGKIILSDGTTNVYSTPLWPTTAGASGSVVISDGTNKINSTSLWPNTVGTAGKIIRSDGTTNAYTTSTFADTYAVSTLLFAGSANAVIGLATANSAQLVTGSTGVPAWSGTMTNGQMIIGSTGATPTVGTITGSGNITVTVGAGTLALSLTGPASFAYNNVSGTTQAAAVNNGYIIGNASQTTVTLPATAAQGSVIAIQGLGAGGWIMTANTGQTIKLGSSTTSSAGSLTSTNLYDALEVVCITANTTWAVKSVIGNITVT